MTLEYSLKILISEILDDLDPEKFFLLDAIYPHARKVYETLNARPDATDDIYLELNAKLTELVEQQIDEFDARKKFGCPYSTHCPF